MDDVHISPLKRSSRRRKHGLWILSPAMVVTMSVIIATRVDPNERCSQKSSKVQPELHGREPEPTKTWWTKEEGKVEQVNASIAAVALI